MSSKTHQTALAIVPPQEVWRPIQAIREQYDRQFHRWMPYVNLLYPYYPAERFDEAIPRLIAACAQFTPFVVTLGEFRFFRHSSGQSTLWLAPEPKEELIRLQAALQSACPECDDLSRLAAEFTPHLSVGQARSAEEACQLREDWKHTWAPIRFELSAVALLWRRRETPFDVERWIPLATKKDQAS
jgi:2'-5' RNA ligase